MASVSWKPFQDGFCIADAIVYGASLHEGDYVFLEKTRGDDMPLKGSHHYIAYPGEYDIRNMFFEAIEVKGLLHYIVTMEDTKFAIIGHAVAFEHQDMSDVDVRFLTDAGLETAMDRMELEGKRIVLTVSSTDQ